MMTTKFNKLKIQLYKNLMMFFLAKFLVEVSVGLLSFVILKRC